MLTVTLELGDDGKHYIGEYNEFGEFMGRLCLTDIIERLEREYESRTSPQYRIR